MDSVKALGKEDNSEVTNMASVLRFQNTLTALRDCHDHLDDPDLSEPEEKAREALLKLCKRIVEEENWS